MPSQVLAQTSCRSAGYVPVSTPPAIISDSTLLLTSLALRLTAALNYSLQSSIDTSVLSVRTHAVMQHVYHGIFAYTLRNTCAFCTCAALLLTADVCIYQAA